jgi:hypothetical protein
MQRSELDRHLIELLDQATWIEGIRYLLADYQFGDGRPRPHYRSEDQIWALPAATRLTEVAEPERSPPLTAR